MPFNGYLAFCPLSLVTKTPIIFRAANAQLKKKTKHISQTPLQLVYAIILTPIIKFKSLLRISGKEICTSPCTSSNAMPGAMGVICKYKSQMFKDGQTDTE